MIYIFNQEGTTLYKIGKSKNVKTRLKQLQTGCPSKLNIITSFNCNEDEEAKLEKAIHRRFSHCATSGEWFDFVDTSILEVIDNIHGLKNIVHQSIKGATGNELVKASKRNL